MISLSKDDPLPMGRHGLPATAMMFVDGENLAIRFAKILGELPLKPHVQFQQNVYVWTRYANMPHDPRCEIIRRFYYTAVQGDDPKLEQVVDSLKELGIEAPRVFRKEKGRASKRVDIQLATELLGHAHRGNYDLAILVAGDEDYVPLVAAVQREASRCMVCPERNRRGAFEGGRLLIRFVRVAFCRRSSARVHAVSILGPLIGEQPGPMTREHFKAARKRLCATFHSVV